MHSLPVISQSGAIFNVFKCALSFFKVLATRGKTVINSAPMPAHWAPWPVKTKPILLSSMASGIHSSFSLKAFNSTAKSLFVAPEKTPKALMGNSDRRTPSVYAKSARFDLASRMESAATTVVRVPTYFSMLPAVFAENVRRYGRFVVS